jgi:SAM-dependent methyltransferase
MSNIPDIANANEEQLKYWNSVNAEKWVENQETMDFSLSAVADEVISRAVPQPGERTIDIGCGTGATSLRLAEKVGPSGSLLGVDISADMLGLAKKRATAAGFEHARFELADAQVHPFEHGNADLLASRFGVMFFDDPIAAFANMLSALRPGGRLVFASWAPLKDNPWFRIPLEAAIDRLGRPAPVPPHAPGPLAFSDLDYANDILRKAGYADTRVDVAEVLLTSPGDLDATAAQAVRVGPATRIIREFEGTKEDEAAIAQVVRAGMAAFDGPEGVRTPASLHMLHGRRPE